MRKPKTKKIAMKRALKAMSNFIRERDNWTCISCGKSFNKYEKESKMRLDAGHLFSRRYKAILFSEVNVNAQCVYCNRYLNGNWDNYLPAFIEKYGTAAYDVLQHEKKYLRKYTIDDLFDIEKYFVNKYNELKEGE